MEHLKHFDEVLKYGTRLSIQQTSIAVLTGCAVNELSNTIDLPSTLLRAQSLFRRFQRTVEAIDKRDNFPTPTVRQRKPDTGKSPASSRIPNNSAAVSGTDRRRPTSSSGIDEDNSKERIISPELRQLLSRKVEVLDKKDVAEHGGGVSA